MAYRYSASCEWGDIFGLSPDDLTNAQLHKIDFRKLVEIANSSQRAQIVLGDRILKATREELQCLHRLENKEIEKLPYAIEQYNTCIKYRSKYLENKSGVYYYHKRRDYVFWRILNDSNKIREFVKWINSESSIIDTKNINYEWLYNSSKYVADQVVNKLLNNIYDKDAVIRMVRELPEEPLKRFIDKICVCEKWLYINLLSNKYTPREYVSKCLREIAGRTNVPPLNITIDRSMLLEFPPVTRLKVIESVLLFNKKRGRVIFLDINEEEFKDLLFSTAIKYNARVERAVKLFKSLPKIQ
jgi:hypothetical protein